MMDTIKEHPQSRRKQGCLVIVSFLSVFLHLGCLQADQSTISKTNKIQSSLVEGGKKSVLYLSCKSSVSENKIHNSYCSDVIKSIYSGYSVIAQSFPPAVSSGECSAKIQDKLNEINWLLLIQEDISISQIATNFVNWVDGGGEVISSLKRFLIYPEELDMASSIISYYNNSSISFGNDQNKKINTLFEISYDRDAPALFKSCQSASLNKENYCTAMISGIWIGYALAHYGLKYPETTDKCDEAIKQNVFKGFENRYLLGPACYAERRKTNDATIKSYLKKIAQKSPDKIMVIGKESPYLEMIRTIEATCENKVGD